MQRHVHSYFEEFQAVIRQLDFNAVERIALELATVRASGGRAFIVGIGGSASTASHFASDLRRLASLEAHAMTDSVAAFSARANDDGWENAFVSCLEDFSPRPSDVVIGISVGGGDVEANVSVNLVRVFDVARTLQCTRIALVGRDGGALARLAEVAVLVPTVSESRVTFHVESMHLAICHAIVSHPTLQSRSTYW